MPESNYIQIKIGNESYDVEVGDISVSPVDVTVNGNIYSVDISKYLKNIQPKKRKITKKIPTRTKKQENITKNNNTVNNSVKSPMPGTILGVKVSVGDTVKAGDELLVLESMKMENMINSPIDGTISKILISEGDSVQHGQELIIF
ncbi:MAG: acetyl-CoA carboxylase biotin carboxyl carrier protein subunit [Dehalococcoidia bacterium]|nr:acetyl-CoA carboxylase biotin carboxyl carrier protein subunit [Dehalococcoidia bacterium]MQG09749.1 biotin/lipoyl-binding protein [SAR202 cluster bacterium]